MWFRFYHFQNFIIFECHICIKKLKHLSNCDNMLNNMSLGLITMRQLKKRCHLHWIARNIQDKPIQRPRSIVAIRFFRISGTWEVRQWFDRNRTWKRHFIKKFRSKKYSFIEKYSFSFGIIWNDKLRCSRTSLKIREQYNRI